MFFHKNKPGFSEDNLKSVIDACLAQNKQAQRTLIKLFYAYTKSISMRYAANLQEAEEIMDDTFLKVFNNLAKYDNELPFKAWLKTIIVNTGIDYYRKNLKYTHQIDISEYHTDIQDLSEDVISKIAADEILLMVQQLPPACRMVFNLYAIEGYNHREIAGLLGIKEGTSKSNLQDARRKLMHRIKQAHPQIFIAYSLKTNKINDN